MSLSYPGLALTLFLASTSGPAAAQAPVEAGGTFDKSGLFLVAGAEVRSQIRVIDVIPGSPAADAGRRIGDQLTTLDGKAPGELALERERRRLWGPAGTKVDLTFERDGKLVRVTLVLRRVV